MKSLVPLSLALASSVNAWTFHWHDSRNQSHIENGVGETNCTVINMTKGMVYKWDPEASPYCINMYRNPNCTSDRNGWSCGLWGPRPLGQDFVHAWQVTRMADPAATTSTITSNSTTATPTPTSSTVPAPVTVTAVPSETAEPAPPAGSQSLSGGAIGGIIVGSLAGGAAVAALGFFFWRRRRSKPDDHHTPAAKLEQGPSGPSGPSDDKYPLEEPPMKERGHELDSNPATPVVPPAFGATSPQAYASPDEKNLHLFSEKYGNARPPIPELPDNTPIAELDTDIQKHDH